MNNKALSRKQKLERFERHHKAKRLEIKVDIQAYIKAYETYGEIYNKIATEFVAENGRKVKEVV